MNDRDETKIIVEDIMEKYDRNFAKLQKNGTAKELKTVFKYVAEEANRKQRVLVGLENEE